MREKASRQPRWSASRNWPTQPDLRLATSRQGRRNAMSKPVFVYVTYIASTLEKVFKALTDTDATAKYWFGHAVTSDWKVGSPVKFHREGKLTPKRAGIGKRS